MQTGYLTLGRIRGAVVRIHWSAFAIALLLGYARSAPWWASLLGSVLVVALIMAHEFGHAFMVWRYRHRVIAIEVFAFHGWCRWDGHPSRYERAMISWGGVFAQLALLAATLLIALLVPSGGYLRAIVLQVFIWTNLYLACINLIPIAPLDGAEAWKLIPLLRDRRPKRPRMDDMPPPRAGGNGRRAPGPKLRLLTPPPDDEPVSESSRKIADSAIQDALERSRRKFDRETNDD